MTRRAARTDGNHSEIARAIARVPGCLVVDVHAFPAIGCDLLVYWRRQCIHVEVKDGTKPPSARRLTPTESEAKRRCEITGNTYAIVTSVADAVALLTR